MVLAAGGARRFGSQKLVTPLAGKPVVRWSVEHVIAAGVRDVLVVVGHERTAVRAALSGLSIAFVEHALWSDGMGASIAAGAAAVPAGATGVLVVLGDQPGVPVAVLERLRAVHELDPSGIAVPVYRGVRGNPVLFPAALLGELRRASGDRGARSIVERNAPLVREVAFDLAMPGDVDRPGDLAEVGPE